MDGDDDDDDDDASSPREEEKEKVEDTEERKTLEKWRHSSLYPEETRASRWASKLLKTEVVTTNKQQTRKKDEHFQKLLERARIEPTKTTLETLSQIEKDLPRSGHTFEKCGLSKPGDKMWNSLKHVLLAFAQHDPATGYVQSMNFICAFFLLSGMDEESAFWCLDGLVNRIVPGYFTEGMAKAMEDQRVFSRVVNKIEPELGVHLDALGAVSYTHLTLPTILRV